MTYKGNLEDKPVISEENRIDYIDLFKAFGIIVMIMGHIGFGSFFSKWLHCFHMPMFFVISGYLQKDAPFKKFFLRRCKTLLLPYFAFGLAQSIIYFIINGGYNVDVLKSLFWVNTNGNMPIAGALWFLTAIFISDMLFWVLQHSHLSIYLSTIIALILAICGMAFATYLPFRLPFALDVGLVGVGFFQCGKLLKVKLHKLIHMKFAYSIITLVVSSVVAFLNSSVNLRTGHYGIWLLFGISSIGITISLWNCSRIFYEWAKKKRALTIMVHWLIDIGKNSIIYLCLNQLSILVSRQIISCIFNPPNNDFIMLAANTLVLFLTMTILYFVERIIVGTKLKVIIGR